MIIKTCFFLYFYVAERIEREEGRKEINEKDVEK